MEVVVEVVVVVVLDDEGEGRGAVNLGRVWEEAGAPGRGMTGGEEMGRAGRLAGGRSVEDEGATRGCIDMREV